MAYPVMRVSTAWKKGRTYYTSNAGLLELRQEISKYVQNKYKVSYDPKSEILVTVGGSEAIDLSMRAMLEPGDEVLIPQHPSLHTSHVLSWQTAWRNLSTSKLRTNSA